MLKNLRERCSEEVQFSSLSLVSDMINEFGDSEIYSDQGRGGMGGGGDFSIAAYENILKAVRLVFYQVVWLLVEAVWNGQSLS